MGNIFRHFTGWASSCHGNRCWRRLPNRVESFFFDKQYAYFHRLFRMRGFDYGSVYLTSGRAVLAWSLSPMRRLSQSARWTCLVFSKRWTTLLQNRLHQVSHLNFHFFVKNDICSKLYAMLSFLCNFLQERYLLQISDYLEPNVSNAVEWFLQPIGYEKHENRCTTWPASPAIPAKDN